MAVRRVDLLARRLARDGVHVPAGQVGHRDAFEVFEHRGEGAVGEVEVVGAQRGRQREVGVLRRVLVIDDSGAAHGALVARGDVGVVGGILQVRVVGCDDVQPLVRLGPCNQAVQLRGIPKGSLGADPVEVGVRNHEAVQFRREPGGVRHGAVEVARLDGQRGRVLREGSLRGEVEGIRGGPVGRDGLHRGVGPGAVRRVHLARLGDGRKEERDAEAPLGAGPGLGRHRDLGHPAGGKCHCGASSMTVKGAASRAEPGWTPTVGAWKIRRRTARSS